MVAVNVTRVVWVALLGACATTPPVGEPVRLQVNGSGLLLDLSPANRPALLGSLDFDLLPSGSGKACVDRGTSTRYWVGMADVAKLSSDPLTQQAIAAAVMDAVARLDDTDAILMTRVVTESKGSDRICATVVGRGIRLTKALGPSGSGEGSGIK